LLVWAFADCNRHARIRRRLYASRCSISHRRGAAAAAACVIAVQAGAGRYPGAARATARLLSARARHAAAPATTPEPAAMRNATV
jgi:hypothetical protein